MNAWVKDALERFVRAFSAATVSVLVVGDGVLNAFNADWPEALGVGLGAGIVSVLYSLAALKIGNDGTASLTNATVPAPGENGPVVR